MTTQNLLGFHAVRARMQQAPDTIVQVFYDAKRRDRRKQQLIDLLQQANVEITPTNKAELDSLAQGGRHQGIVAIAQQLTLATDVFTLLDELADQEVLPFLLILDDATDPHNLDAYLRTADAAAAHGLIAHKDRAVGVTPVVLLDAGGAEE